MCLASLLLPVPCLPHALCSHSTNTLCSFPSLPPCKREYWDLNKFDATTGKLVWSKSWQNNPIPNGVVASDNFVFVIRYVSGTRSTKVTRYSAVGSSPGSAQDLTVSEKGNGAFLVADGTLYVGLTTSRLATVAASLTRDADTWGRAS